MKRAKEALGEEDLQTLAEILGCSQLHQMWPSWFVITWRAVQEELWDLVEDILEKHQVNCVVLAKKLLCTSLFYQDEVVQRILAICAERVSFFSRWDNDDASISLVYDVYLDRHARALVALKTGWNPFLFYLETRELQDLFFYWTPSCHKELGLVFNQQVRTFLLCLCAKSIALPKDLRFLIIRMLAVASYFYMRSLGEVTFRKPAQEEYLAREALRLTGQPYYGLDVRSHYVEVTSSYHLFRFPFHEHVSTPWTQVQQIAFALREHDATRLCQALVTKSDYALADLFPLLFSPDKFRSFVRLYKKDLDVPYLLEDFLLFEHADYALILLEEVWLHESFLYRLENEYEVRCMEGMEHRFSRVNLIPWRSLDILYQGGEFSLLEDVYHWDMLGFRYWTPDLKKRMLTWMLVARSLALPPFITKEIARWIPFWLLKFWKLRNELASARAFTVYQLRQACVPFVGAKAREMTRQELAHTLAEAWCW